MFGSNVQPKRRVREQEPWLHDCKHVVTGPHVTVTLKVRGYSCLICGERRPLRAVG